MLIKLYVLRFWGFLSPAMVPSSTETPEGDDTLARSLPVYRLSAREASKNIVLMHGIAKVLEINVHKPSKRIRAVTNLINCELTYFMRPYAKGF
jgi:hypothetical protein